jgi:hypothetical protein
MSSSAANERKIVLTSVFQAEQNKLILPTSPRRHNSTTLALQRCSYSTYQLLITLVLHVCYVLKWSAVGRRHVTGILKK